MNSFVVLRGRLRHRSQDRGQDLDRLTKSLKALYATDEFADVVSAARSQLGNTLRDLAAVVDGQQNLPDSGDDIVARVRHLVGSR